MQRVVQIFKLEKDLTYTEWFRPGGRIRVLMILREKVHTLKRKNVIF